MRSREISPISEVVIYRKVEDVWLPTYARNVMSYSMSFDRHLGAATLTLECSNPDGRYSYDRDTPENTLAVPDVATHAVSDFSGGTFLGTAVSSGKLVLAQSSGRYVSKGTYLSPPIDGGTSHRAWKSIEYSVTHDYVFTYKVYGTTRAHLRVRTSPDSTSWSEWSNEIEIPEGVLLRDSLNSLFTKANLQERYLQVEVTLSTPDGSISPAISSFTVRDSLTSTHHERVPLYGYMNKVVLREGIETRAGTKWYPKFCGLIDTVTPSVTAGGGEGLRVECRDMMKLLIVNTIDVHYEPDKVRVAGGALSEDPSAQVPRTVYVFPYNNICKSPMPIVYVGGEEISGGYEIDYAGGLLYMGNQVAEGKAVTADYYRYNMATNKAGDVIRDIARRSGFENSDVVLDFTMPGTEIVEEPTIPLHKYTYRDKKTCFDALQDVCKYIAPNFMVRCDAEGRLTGSYSVQKTEPDYELTLKKSIELPISDEDIYTQVRAYGRREENSNHALTATAEWYSMNESGVYNVWDSDAWGYYGGCTTYAKAVIDGDINSRFGWWWAKSDGNIPPQNRDAVMITLRDPIKIGRLDILFGPGPAYRTLSYRASVFFAPEEPNPDGSKKWQIAGSSLRNFGGSANQWVVFDESQMDEVDSKTKYIKIQMNSAAEYGTWDGPDAAFCISEIQIRETDVIEGIATARLDIREKVGLRVMPLEVDPLLVTPDEVKERASIVLTEVSRNLRSATVDVIYAPHLDVGKTVLVTSEPLGLNRLFYIERITHQTNSTSPSVTLDIVCYD